MPTVNLDRTEFFKRLGKEYCKFSNSQTYTELLLPSQSYGNLIRLLVILTAFKDFDELLFEYGLELDEDVSDILLFLLLCDSS